MSAAVNMPPAFISLLVNQTVNTTYHILSTWGPSSRSPSMTMSQTQPSDSLRMGRGPKLMDGSDLLDDASKQFTQIVEPIALATGIIGNALLAVVFLITPLRLRPFSHTLAGLGVVNLLYTLICLVIYLTKKSVMMYKIPGICQMSTFTLVFCKSIEAWLIFISHLNRLNAHTNAGHESRRRRVFNTKFAIILLAMFVAAPSLHLLWSVEVVKYGQSALCVPMKETIAIHLIIRKIELIGSVFLPLTLITGVDLMLVLKMVAVFLYKEEDDDDGVHVNNDGHSSNNSDKYVPANGHFSPAQEIVFVHTGGRLSTIDELSSTLSKAVPHRVKKSISSLQQNDHLAAEKTVEDACTVLLNLSGRQARDATSPISFHFLFDSISQSESSCQLPNVPIHKGFSDESLNNIDSTGKIESCTILSEDANLNDKLLKENNDCLLANVEILKPDPVEQTDLEFQNGQQNGNSAKPSEAPSKFFGLNLRGKNWSRNKVEDNNKYDLTHDSVTYSKARSYTQKAFSINNSITNSISGSQWRSYTYASYASYASNSSKPPATVVDGQIFPSDTTPCTVCTMLTGVLYASLVLPSAYTQALSLFGDGPSSTPSIKDIQQAILYESLVKLNAAYKFFLCFFLMPSFRSAILWLITRWFPNKLTRASNFCPWDPKRKAHESAFV